ncbi:MAG: AMP-binding protein, partial [Planctomycetota bacterium]
MLTATRAMLRSCRKALFRWKVADSTGDALTGGAVLTKALVLRRLLLREVLAPRVEDEQYVGILLPPSNGGALVNAAVTLAGRVSVNLNYSVTSEVLNACIRQAGIRHVLTSRKVLDKLGLEIDADVVLLEDFKDKVGTTDKAVAATLAFATPMPVLERLLGVDRVELDDELTVIFTSGSTGEPKGVVLTHRNIMSNVIAMKEVVRLDSEDVMLGVLPFFHSFGYTVTLWGPLALDIRVAYHFSPLDARQVGKLAGVRGATILLATPTFLRSYLKRCTKENFATLDVVVAGAEKLPVALSDAFEEKFGVRPVEGYGATELAPLVSVNVPPSRTQTDSVDCREGSVGQPVKDVVAKIVNPDTGEPVAAGGEGMLLISGPNLMKGYLHDPEKTAGVIQDGWYVTGDIAR